MTERCSGPIRPAIVAAALLASAAGCGANIAPKTAGSSGSARDALVLETLAQTREGTALVVSEGDTLRTGDRLWFRVRTEGPAYIYVIQVSPDSSAELLYPERGDVLLDAGGAQRVPGDPRQHFVLDERPGLEQVLLIASRSPLAESDGRLANLVQLVKHQRKWPSDIPLDAAGRDASAAGAEPPGASAGDDANDAGSQEARADAPAAASSEARHQPGGNGARRPQSTPARPDAEPGGFLDLLGSTRSLERGLRLETDTSRLRVVPDETGIAVSLFRFHHVP